jgi:hypothetical protein
MDQQAPCRGGRHGGRSLQTPRHRADRPACRRGHEHAVEPAVERAVLVVVGGQRGAPGDVDTGLQRGELARQHDFALPGDVVPTRPVPRSSTGSERPSTARRVGIPSVDRIMALLERMVVAEASHVRGHTDLRRRRSTPGQARRSRGVGRLGRDHGSGGALASDDRLPRGPEPNRALGVWGGIVGIGATAGLLIGGPVTTAPSSGRSPHSSGRSPGSGS